MQLSAESMHQWLKEQSFSGGEVNELAKTLTLVHQIGLTNPFCQGLIPSVQEKDLELESALSFHKTWVSVCIYWMSHLWVWMKPMSQKSSTFSRKESPKDKGFIVVDHHPLFQTSFDKVIHFGPGAGIHGGTILEKPLEYELIDPAEFEAKDFATFRISNNILPLYDGAIHVITGPSGSGKTIHIKQVHSVLQKHAQNAFCFSAVWVHLETNDQHWSQSQACGQTFAP